MTRPAAGPMNSQFPEENPNEPSEEDRNNGSIDRGYRLVRRRISIGPDARSGCSGGRFAQGRIAGLGFDAEVNGEKSDMDVLRIKFRSADDLNRGDLAGFLKEHLAALGK